MFLALFSSHLAMAQQSLPGGYNKAYFQKYISDFLKENKGVSAEENFYKDSILDHTAGVTVDFSVKEGKASTKHPKYPKAQDRLFSVGGSNSAMVAEFAFDVKVLKKGEFVDQKKVQDQLWKKLRKSKHLKLLKSPDFFFAGSELKIDSAEGKMFVSVVLADINALNVSSAHLSELTVPYTSKSKYGVDKGKNFKMALMGLFGTSDTCANLDEALVNDLTFNGFFVSENKVYLKKAYVAKYKSLFLRKNSALAIDVVSQDQFPTEQFYNITDEELFTTGYLLKPQYGKDVWLMEENKDQLVGLLPANLSGKVNFNLFLYECKNCNAAYSTEHHINQEAFSKLYNSFRPVSLALNYDTAGTKLPEFKAKENKIAFNFPFELGKFKFKQSDIQPLIDSLGEPSFVINKVNIEAYSSIEGDSAINAKLQKGRSGSIVGVLEKMNENVKIPYTVNTNTGWRQFQEQVKGTQWENLADSSFAFVNDSLNGSKDFRDSVEFMLSAQRYARVELYVTYKEPDLDENEYFLFKYKKAIKQGRSQDALALMNELIKNGKKKMLLSVDVPGKPEFASLLNNLLCINAELMNSNEEFEGLYDYANNLYKNNKEHHLIRFNYASLTLEALNRFREDKDLFRDKFPELLEIKKSIQTTPIISFDEVAQLNTKLFYYETINGGKLLDDKKENKKLLNVVKGLSQLEDVVAFIDLFEKKGNYTAAYELTKLNFNKFRSQLLDAKSAKQKELASQYVLRYIPYFEKLEKESRTPTVRDAFLVLLKNDPVLLSRLFEENILSFQFFANLYVKHYYNKSTSVAQESIGL